MPVIDGKISQISGGVMFLIIIYYCLFLFIGVFTHGLIKNKKRRLKIETVLCFIALFIFFGFRDITVLNDTADYYGHFRYILQYTNNLSRPIYNIDPYDRFEPAYQIFENILGKITKEPYAIIMVSSFIISYSYLKFIKKFTHNISLCVFILLTMSNLTFMYSGIRQGLATCIFFLAYPYLIDKSLLRYYCLVFVAIFFHISACVLLILPMFHYFNLNKKNIIASGFISLMISGNIMTLLEPYVADSNYYETQLEQESMAFAVILNIATALFFILWSFYIKKRYNINLGKSKLLWWISISSLYIQICSVKFSILSRCSYYFFVFIVILLLSHIFTIPKQYKTNHILLLLLFVMVRCVSILILKNEWYHLYPYSFFDFTQLYHDTDIGY